MVFKLLRTAIPFIWFGAVCAISFIEAPLKFHAPNITVALGLGIGRLVFHALNAVEIVLGLLFLVSLIVTRAGERWSGAILPGIVFSVLFLQSGLLLPALDARAEAMLSDNPPPPSQLHIIYIVMDAAKVVLLLTIGCLYVTQLVKKGRDL